MAAKYTTTATTTKTKKTTESNKGIKIAVADNKDTWEQVPAIVPAKESSGEIGYLGKVLFIVSNDQVKTINNFVHTMSAKFAEHERHMKAPMLEFTGLESQTITFDIELSVYLGQKSVKKSVDELYKYLKNGKMLSMKLGDTTYGPYRWCITKLTMKGKTTDTKGNWTSAGLSVSLVSVEKK